MDLSIADVLAYPVHLLSGSETMEISPALLRVKLSTKLSFALRGTAEARLYNKVYLENGNHTHTHSLLLPRMRHPNGGS